MFSRTRRGWAAACCIGFVVQFVFYLVYGPAVGATAGLMSGRAITEALPVQSLQGGA